MNVIGSSSAKRKHRAVTNSVGEERRYVVMTLVGLEYLKHQETQKHNRATEGQAKLDTEVKERIADADRSSKEKIASADRGSKEQIASLDRQAKIATDNANRVNAQLLKHIDVLENDKDRALKQTELDDKLWKSQQDVAVAWNQQALKKRAEDRADFKQGWDIASDMIAAIGEVVPG